MRSGNGIDLAAIYQLLTEVAEKVASHDRRFELIDRRFEQIDRRFEQIDRRFDQVAEVLDEHSRKIDDVAAGLHEVRLAMYQYHSAVVTHGLDISELNDRVGRLERRPPDPA